MTRTGRAEGVPRNAATSSKVAPYLRKVSIPPLPSAIRG